MATPLNLLTDDQIQNLIENHRNKKKTDSPIYLEALAEQSRRHGRGLNFEKTMKIVLEAAQKGRFISYKELADASAADWGKVHYTIGGHLGDLVEYAHRRGWPLLSAIVVNKPNLSTGEMEPSTLKGFIAAAKGLGYQVTDEQAFLREQQARVFEWASDAALTQNSDSAKP